MDHGLIPVCGSVTNCNFDEEIMKNNLEIDQGKQNCDNIKSLVDINDSITFNSAHPTKMSKINHHDEHSSSSLPTEKKFINPITDIFHNNSNDSSNNCKNNTNNNGLKNDNNDATFEKSIFIDDNDKSCSKCTTHHMKADLTMPSTCDNSLDVSVLKKEKNISDNRPEKNHCADDTTSVVCSSDVVNPPTDTNCSNIAGTSNDDFTNGEKSEATSSRKVSIPGIVISKPQWNVGDMLWGRVSGHPWWPCMIAMDPSNTIFRKLSFRRNKSSAQYHVQFFGDECERGWLNESSMMPYKGREEFESIQQGMLNMSAGNSTQLKKDRKSFIIKFRRQNSWNHAIAYAEAAFEMNLEERISKCTYVYNSSQMNQAREKLKQRKRKMQTSSSENDATTTAADQRQQQSLGCESSGIGTSDKKSYIPPSKKQKLSSANVRYDDEEDGNDFEDDEDGEIAVSMTRNTPRSGRSIRLTDKFAKHMEEVVRKKTCKNKKDNVVPSSKRKNKSTPDHLKSKQMKLPEDDAMKSTAEPAQQHLPAALQDLIVKEEPIDKSSLEKSDNQSKTDNVNKKAINKIIVASKIKSPELKTVDNSALKSTATTTTTTTTTTTSTTLLASILKSAESSAPTSTTNNASSSSSKDAGNIIKINSLLDLMKKNNKPANVATTTVHQSLPTKICPSTSQLPNKMTSPLTKSDKKIMLLRPTNETSTKDINLKTAQFTKIINKTSSSTTETTTISKNYSSDQTVQSTTGAISKPTSSFTNCINTNNNKTKSSSKTLNFNSIPSTSPKQNKLEIKFIQQQQQTRPQQQQTHQHQFRVPSDVLCRSKIIVIQPETSSPSPPSSPFHSKHACNQSINDGDINTSNASNTVVDMFLPFEIKEEPLDEYPATTSTTTTTSITTATSATTTSLTTSTSILAKTSTATASHAPTFPTKISNVEAVSTSNCKLVAGDMPSTVNTRSVLLPTNGTSASTQNKHTVLRRSLEPNKQATSMNPIVILPTSTPSLSSTQKQQNSISKSISTASSSTPKSSKVISITPANRPLSSLMPHNILAATIMRSVGVNTDIGSREFDQLVKRGVNVENNDSATQTDVEDCSLYFANNFEQTSSSVMLPATTLNVVENNCQNSNNNIQHKSEESELVDAVQISFSDCSVKVEVDEDEIDDETEVKFDSNNSQHRDRIENVSNNSHTNVINIFPGAIHRNSNAIHRHNNSSSNIDNNNNNNTNTSTHNCEMVNIDGNETEQVEELEGEDENDPPLLEAGNFSSSEASSLVLMASWALSKSANGHTIIDDCDGSFQRDSGSMLEDADGHHQQTHSDKNDLCDDDYELVGVMWRMKSVNSDVSDSSNDNVPDDCLNDADNISQHRQQVCSVCEVPDDNNESSSNRPMIRCQGPCNGSYHLTCAGVAKADDELAFRCHQCDTGCHTCFLCKRSTKDTVQCTYTSNKNNKFKHNCKKYYHVDCLSKFTNSTTNASNLICPLHTCLTCSGRHKKANKGEMYQCIKCPRAYHVNQFCLPASCQILSSYDSAIVCDAHVGSCAGDHIKASAHWCFLCFKEDEYGSKSPADQSLSGTSSKVTSKFNKNGKLRQAMGESLVTCSTCPISFHPSCVRLSPVVGEIRCRDCVRGGKGGGCSGGGNERGSGGDVHYGDVVWCKIGPFRWWPSEVINPGLNVDDGKISDKNMEVSESIFNRKSEQRSQDVLVRLYGCNLIYRLHRLRLLPFREGDYLSQQVSHWKVHDHFTAALEEASMQLARRMRDKEKEFQLDQKLANKPDYYKHIRSNIPIGNVEILKGAPFENPVCHCTIGNNGSSSSSNDNNFTDSQRCCGLNSDCINRTMMFECHPLVCIGKDRCMNQCFTKRLDADTKIMKTEEKGWALFSKSEILKGQFIGEYVGELIDTDESKKRLEDAQLKGCTNFYMLTLDRNRVIDAGPKGNHTRFMNHSCEPNCETQKWTVNGDVRIGLFALQDIAAGTELTFNYNFDCYGTGITKCKCGSSICSGYLGVKPKTAAAWQVEKRSLETKMRRLQAKSVQKTNKPVKKPNKSSANGPNSGQNEAPTNRRSKKQINNNATTAHNERSNIDESTSANHKNKEGKKRKHLTCSNENRKKIKMN